MPFFGQPQKLIPQNVSFFMTAKINSAKKKSSFALQLQKLIPQKLMDLGQSQEISKNVQEVSSYKKVIFYKNFCFLPQIFFSIFSFFEKWQKKVLIKTSMYETCQSCDCVHLGDLKKTFKKNSITWSPERILYLGSENKTKCDRVWVRKKLKTKMKEKR